MSSVFHNESEQRFEVQLADKLAFLEYQSRPGEIALVHTEVPREARGQGIADDLVRTALDHARAEHLAVAPLCPFVAKYIQRHPQYMDVLKPKYRQRLERAS